MPRPAKPLVMPERGVIKGGLCNGWRYRFLQFRVVPIDIGWSVPVGHALRVEARISAPNWPFPHEGLLDERHFGQFRAVPGDRAKRLKAEPLITGAYTVAGLVPPVWSDRDRTLRARVKRSGVITRRGRAAP